MKGKGGRRWRAGLLGAAYMFALSGLQAGITPATAAAQTATQRITNCGSEYGRGRTASGPAQGTVAYAVDTGGTWTFACGGTGPFTIGIASTLDVAAGERVTLLGGGRAVTLDGDTSGTATQIFSVPSTGSLTLEGLTLEKGRAILNHGALTVSDSTFSDNGSTGVGGAIANRADGTLTVYGSTFTGNAGGIGGGAIANDGMLKVHGSTFTGNAGGIGGGAIYNDGTVTVTDSTFSGNAAPGGGGGAIDNGGTLRVGDSTFSGNQGGMGGGGAIANGDTLNVANSTFSGNTAPGAYGGAIINEGTLTVTSSTFSGNTAADGDNLYQDQDGSTTTLYDTILADTASGGNCDFVSGTAGGANDLESGDTTNTCTGTFTKWVYGNPHLGPLGRNGGPTQTMALLPGSAAIGAGAATICAAHRFDQRGYPRPPSGCDVGAYERTAPSGGKVPFSGPAQTPNAPAGSLTGGDTVTATIYAKTNGA